MDASDVFQDGVIAFHKNVIDRKFKGESAIGTYLYSICRFIWLKKLQNNGMSLTDIESIDHATYEDPEFRLLDNEKRQMVSALFDELGEPCQTILTLAYYDNIPMAEIAVQTRFKDEQNVRNKKYKCMKSPKELIMSAPKY